MKHVTASAARADLFGLIKAIANGDQIEPVLVTSRSGDVVMISAAEWADIEATLFLMSIPGAVETIKEGATDEAFSTSIDSKDLGF